MKNLKLFLQEAFRVNEVNKPNQYTSNPKNKNELIDILEERLEKDPNADLNDIDVSKITDMSELFMGLDPHDINISEWDVSNVKDMHSMFLNCENVNCDLSNWNVSKVTNMAHMFNGCVSFEGKGLENWDVSNVEEMGTMFNSCHILNCDLNKWNTSKVENMRHMFYDCVSLRNKPKWYKD